MNRLLAGNSLVTAPDHFDVAPLIAASRFQVARFNQIAAKTLENNTV